MKNWSLEVQKLEGWSFGDNPQMADDLAAQTAEGKSLANCYLWREGGKVPELGERSYVKNSMGNPVCVVEVVEVKKIPFCEVDSSFALAEGYSTLAEWQSVHRDFFVRLDQKFNEQTLVICQRFKLLHVF